MHAHKVPLIIVTPTGSLYARASISVLMRICHSGPQMAPITGKAHKTPQKSNRVQRHLHAPATGARRVCPTHTPAKSTCSPPAKSPSHQLLIWWISTHAKTIISRGKSHTYTCKYINHSNMVYIRSSRNKGTQLAMQVHLITVIKR